MKACGTRATTERRSALFVLMMSLAAVGCGGGGGGGSAATDDPPAGSGGPQTQQPSGGQPPGNGQQPPDGQPTTGNRAPTIGASPALSASVGVPYSFTPSAEDPDGDALAFSIENRPAWAEFSTVTGELKGTPSAAHLGTYADIRISVSDGTATASLPAFTLTVTAAASDAPVPPASGGTVLSWSLPPEGLDDATLGQLAGFRIHYGHDKDMLHETIEVASPGVLGYSVDTLPPGTYYFAVRAVTATGEQSELSNVVSMVIG